MRRPEGLRGPSQRQLRVGETIRRALSEILARGDLMEPELAGVSLTVGEVRVSPDLRVATVNVSALGGRGGDGYLAALDRSRGELRREVARAVRLKFAPDLRFRQDDSFERLDAARALFDDPKIRQDLDSEG